MLPSGLSVLTAHHRCASASLRSSGSSLATSSGMLLYLAASSAGFIPFGLDSLLVQPVRQIAASSAASPTMRVPWYMGGSSGGIVSDGIRHASYNDRRSAKVSRPGVGVEVEPTGIEPVTSALRTLRSPN